MNPKAIKIAVITLSVLGLFALGRFTAPTLVDTATKKLVKQLIQDTVRLTAERDLALNSMRMYKHKSEEYYAAGINHQAEKIYYKTKYEKEIIHNHSLKPTQLDSSIISAITGLH